MRGKTANARVRASEATAVGRVALKGEQSLRRRPSAVHGRGADEVVCLPQEARPLLQSGGERSFVSSRQVARGRGEATANRSPEICSNRWQTTKCTWCLLCGARMEGAPRVLRKSPCAGAPRTKECEQAVRLLSAVQHPESRVVVEQSRTINDEEWKRVARKPRQLSLLPARTCKGVVQSCGDFACTPARTVSKEVKQTHAHTRSQTKHTSSHQTQTHRHKTLNTKQTQHTHPNSQTNPLPFPFLPSLLHFPNTTFPPHPTPLPQAAPKLSFFFLKKLTRSKKGKMCKS